jgi:hypothetical protein
MPTKNEESKDNEVAQLRARIEDLEARLETERDRSSDTDRDRGDRGDHSRQRGRYEVRASYGERDRYDDDRRPVDRRLRGVTDAGDRKVETAVRTIRGLTLASVEAVRIVADSFANAADSLLDSSRPREDDETLRDLSSRFTESFSDSVSDTASRLMDVPSRSADLFSRSFREGEYRRLRSERDRDEDRDRDRDDRRTRGSREESKGGEVRVEARTKSTKEEDGKGRKSA